MRSFVPLLILLKLIGSTNQEIEEEDLERKLYSGSRGFRYEEKNKFLWALKYFDFYGHLQYDNGRTANQSLFTVFETSLKSFQQFFNLPTSGILDDDTVSAMNTPRCGTSDRQSEDGNIVLMVGLAQKISQQRSDHLRPKVGLFQRNFVDLFESPRKDQEKKDFLRR